MRLRFRPIYRQDFPVRQFHALYRVTVATVNDVDIGNDGVRVAPVVLVGLEGDWLVFAHGILSPGLAARLGWGWVRTAFLRFA